jgi:hypothetical protein
MALATFEQPKAPAGGRPLTSPSPAATGRAPTW